METINIKDIISIKEAVKPLKVAHFAHVKPNSAGISGTAIDMVSAERTAGIDSQIIDYQGNGKPSIVGIEHNGVTTVGPSWAKTADIIVRHSAIPPHIAALNKPQVMCLHGRPEYTFLLHYNKKSELLSEYERCAANPKYRSFITFWQEHLPYLNSIMPDRTIDYVPAMANLEAYNPDGIKLDYGNQGGTPNILICDMFRDDASPFNVLMAAAEYVRKYNSKAKVHIYGLQRQNELPWKMVLDGLKREGIVGQAKSLVPNMEQIYRANDILVTPHRIATRVIRESLASGLPIVAGSGCPYTPYTADARDTEGFAKEIDRCWNDGQGKIGTSQRAIAGSNFGLKRAGEAAKKIYDRIMKEPKPVIEIRTKPMIYNFVAYSPNGKEELGNTYNKYMELLKDDDWACFLDHDAMFTTDDWYGHIADIVAKNPEYGLLTACTNRIGNPEQRIAGLDDTHDIMYHRGIGKRLQGQCGTEVNDVTKTHCISGVVMVVSKKTWKKAGGFKNGFLGIDNDFHQRVAKVSKVGVAKGLYVYHYYRADGTGLQPVAK